MRKAQQTIALAVGLIGVALIVRGAWAGVWPLSIQLLAGILLVAFAFLRWRTLDR